MSNSAEGIVENAATFTGVAYRLTWFEVFFVDDDGNPLPNAEFEVIYAHGKKKTYTADSKGYFREDKAPEGLIKIKMKDGSVIESYGNSDNFSEDDADLQNAQTTKIEYVIRKGDTLSRIAKRFGVKGGWRELYYQTSGPDGTKNSGRLRSGDPNLIFPGEIIWVPTKRQVVRIHTDNAAKGVTKIRVRKKKRSNNQKNIARREDIYYERHPRADKIENKAMDNLLIVAGWDEAKNNIDVKKLCETLSPIIDAIYPNVGKKWNLYLIQKKLMSYYDSGANLQHKFVLSVAPRGLAGAYTIFERNAYTFLTGIYDQSSGLGHPTLARHGGFQIDEIIESKEEKKKYFESFIDFSSKVPDFKRLPVFYQAPATKGEWVNIVLNGGNGLLDNYIGDPKYDEKAYGRNLAVIDTYNSYYRGSLKKYIKDLKTIPAKKGEDAIRALGEPPEPYRFPMPEGVSGSERRKLASKIADCSSYDAWIVISEKIFEMQNERWPDMGTKHQEGNIFFRAKFTLEPNAIEQIDKLAEKGLQLRALPVFGRLSSYRTAKVEWTLDAGTDGIQSGKTYSKTFKEEGVLKARKFEIGVGREVEIDDTGGKKVTVSGKFGSYGAQLSSDGEHRMTGPGFGPIGATAAGNMKTAEGGLGITVGVPGIGSVYLGINFVALKADTLLVYLTGAPGFFEMKSPDTLVRTHWTNLSFPEIEKLKLLGWNQETWDMKDQLDYSTLPQSTRTSIDKLPYEQRIAAMHLGFRGRWDSKWTDFWKKLPPVEGFVQFKSGRVSGRRRSRRRRRRKRY